MAEDEPHVIHLMSYNFITTITQVSGRYYTFHLPTSFSRHPYEEESIITIHLAQMKKLWLKRFY